MSAVSNNYKPPLTSESKIQECRPHIRKLKTSTQSFEKPCLLIDSTALNQSKQWDLSLKRRVDWDWVEGYNDFKFRGGSGGLARLGRARAIITSLRSRATQACRGRRRLNQRPSNQLPTVITQYIDLS